MNQQEDILKKIIRLGCVFQDSQGHATNDTRVATEQKRQRFPAAQANLCDQGLVGNGSASRQTE